MDLVFATVVFVAILILYLLPTIMAIVRDVPFRRPIVLANILLGWTVVFWIVSLAMLFSNMERKFRRTLESEIDDLNSTHSMEMKRLNAQHSKQISEIDRVHQERTDLMRSNLEQQIYLDLIGRENLDYIFRHLFELKPSSIPETLERFGLQEHEEELEVLIESYRDEIGDLDEHFDDLLLLEQLEPSAIQAAWGDEDSDSREDSSAEHSGGFDEDEHLGGEYQSEIHEIDARYKDELKSIMARRLITARKSVQWVGIDLSDDGALD